MTFGLSANVSSTIKLRKVLALGGGGLGELRVVETEESGRKNEDEGLEILADEY